MHRFKRIIAFSWPFVRPYTNYLLVGVLCGVLFGLSNGAMVWLTRSLLTRTNADAYLKAVTPETASSPQAETSPNVGFAPLEGFKGWMRDVKKVLIIKVDQFLDPWFPRAGRPLDWRQILGLLLFMPLFGMGRSFAGYLSTYMLSWTGERVICDLRMGVFSNLINLSLDYFNRSTLGDMVTRINGDTRMLQRTLGHGVEHATKDPMTLVSVFMMLLILDWQLTLIIIVLLPLMMLPVATLARRAKKAARKMVGATVVQSSLIIEMLSGIRVVKAFNLEGKQSQHFNELTDYTFKQTMKGVRARELVSPLLESISLIVVAGLLIFVLQTNRNMPDMAAFFLGLFLFYTPIRKLARLHVLFENTSIGIERLQNILAEQPTVQEPARPKPLPPFQTRIEFDRVTFAYQKDIVLGQFNLTVPRGHRLGIAGESGCGKSTIVNLLFRFFDPQEGAIRIDGINIRDVSLTDLRHQMALVSQDIVIFDRSVAENIACGRPGATRADVEAAAKDAFAHDFIMSLPEGYETRVGERGVTLSGGQRQRLAIARAFVRNAPILVLDEATAALDSRSEAEVQRAIDHLSENRTVLCIAHRLSTLRNMDEIIVLSEGAIVERGSFSELIAAGGRFAEMAGRQSMAASQSQPART